MADSKISQLTGATTPLAGTEVLPIVQSGSTKKVSVANLTAGRSVSASVLTTTGEISSGGAIRITGAYGTNAANQLALQSSAGVSGMYLNGSTTGSANRGTFVMWQQDSAGGNYLQTLGIDVSANVTFNSGNLVQGTAAKGVTTSGSFALGLGANSSTTAVQVFPSGGVSIGNTTDPGATNLSVSGYTIVNSGQFNNVGTAQSITISDTNGGYVVITGVQGGVGSSTWKLNFVKRSGSLAIGTADKAVLTADPISSVTVSSNNILVTPLAANTYITYAIYYTPLGA